MARMLARCILAAVLIAAYIPLPAAPVKGGGHGGQGGHDGLMACCAPKACCSASHACTSGGGCGGAGVAADGGDAAASGSVGAQIFAGGCGNDVPRVTPHQLDPTVSPRVTAWTPIPSTISTSPAPDRSCNSIASRPLVPPPRA